MRIRLPLYVKILLWFFLNVVLLAAVIGLLFNAQFSFDFDWFLTSGARARVEVVRDLIVGELNNVPPDEWQQVLDRYSDAYKVRFSLVDDDGHRLIGDVVELPQEVRDRITARPFPRSRSQSSSTPAASPTPRPQAEPRSPQVRSFAGWRPPFRALMRTKDPTQYWLMTSARIENPQAGPPMRVILVARSRSISGGGLIFDPKPWFWLGVGAIVFSLLFWLPLVRSITHFVYRTTLATRMIAGGRFDVRVTGRRFDELGELGEAINQMASQLDGLVTGQKRFLGDIAHELCSPLAHLQMTLAILEQHVQGSEEKYVRSAVAKAAQIAGLVNELLSFSKASFGASAVRLQPVNVKKAVEEAIRKESGEAADFRVTIPETLAVAADRELFIRAISNVLRNAARHGDPSEPVLVDAVSQGGEVAITVYDSGPGVPEADLGRIFDAFYRVDSSRNRETGGTGLGLTIVKTCIESCCGSVRAANRHPHGLEVTLRLRAADDDRSDLAPTLPISAQVSQQ